MPFDFFFVSLFCNVVVVLVHGQIQTGFISMDCGVPENFNYVDSDTGVSYTSDEPYIGTGVNKNISAEYAYPNNLALPQPLSDLRSFPEGNKNCYTLTPRGGNGSLNLIRASFLYGNYDGENRLPKFELYLDVNLWSVVQFSSAADAFTTEIISIASSDTLSICLVNIGSGTPFISALELRPLNRSIYSTVFRSSGSLVLFERLNMGYSNGSGRYYDDTYDRIWSPWSSPAWENISSTLAVDTSGNGYAVPREVITSAVRPRNGNESLTLSWNTSDPNSQFYIYMYFAELEQLQKNQSRIFNISWNGSPLLGPFTPHYLYATCLSNSKPLVGREHQISLHKTGDSTLPPILNGVEIYMVKQWVELPTYVEDVTAIVNIQNVYNIYKSWVGDPCGPKNCSWEGLTCSYNGSIPPRIISLNLTSRGLSGEIAASIAKLSSLEFLDLSNNSLTGSVPEFLVDLPSLNFLNLKGNRLSGSVPTALLKTSKEGLLTLSVDDQNLCSSDSCKKKNTIAPIVAPVSSILVLFIVLIIIWKLRRRKRQAVTGIFNKDGRSLASKKPVYTYAEIESITNNFQRVIGKGGFGAVYHGQLKDGTEVAVKMLSPSSSQGPKEFQTEAELLVRIHHRNLASFIGYCDDKNMALVYEYMANGNLKDYLSAKSSHLLSWEQRLRIAIDAAQGLEYLHNGCKPPIIHRDVKTANILLSKNLHAKIADFGLSKVFPNDDSLTHVSTAVMGTRGYLDPEYCISQRLNEKSDVYSFGVVLLELITGKPAIIRNNEQIHIVQWVSPLLEMGEIRSIVDQRLQGEFNVNSVRKALEIAMACTTSSSTQRVPMSFVLTELKDCLAIELAKGSLGLREEFSATSSNSTEVFSTDTTDSMTVPSAR
ncbi:probable LRR receptor-like serine/threonine-protein kinase At4g29180 isoform X2 [Malania oleifera]|nr:probable LRR receptor-like serine/threonine-protein kinase At4g29180 isoform X2 [Malania oleifera]XP_057966980.1 probable LRR receptor-like serine/threonine-protein kinase At4g29180 isoform X2 [Malania oleifera]